MSTNKEAFRRAVVSSSNYKSVFKRYNLSTIEIEKLYRYLKPLYIYYEDDYVIFKFPNPQKLDSLIIQ